MSLTANNKLDTNKYELTIHIDAESFEKALEKAYKKNIKKTARAYSLRTRLTTFIRPPSLRRLPKRSLKSSPVRRSK